MNDRKLYLKRLFFYCSMILFANYVLSLVGVYLRQEVFNKFDFWSVFYLLISQILFISSFLLIMNFYYNKVVGRRRVYTVQPSVSLSLLVVFFLFLPFVKSVHDFGDYKEFSGAKTALAEYLFIIYGFYFITKRKLRALDIFLSFILLVYFAFIGYRFVALYMFIMLLSCFRLSLVVIPSIIFLVFLVNSQLTRFGLSSSAFFEVFFYVFSSNAFDTLYSGLLMLETNNNCSYSILIPASFLGHIFPIPSSVFFPFYQEHLHACTPTPGGGVLSAYFFYLVGLREIGFEFVLLTFLFVFFLMVPARKFRFSAPVYAFALIFSYRAFNYGPVALFKPAMISFIVISFLYALHFLTRRK